MGVYLGRNKVDMLGGTPIALNGTNTSDATVTENDLAKDVIAYGANGRIVGKTPTIKNGVFSKASNCSVHSNAKEYVSVDLMCDSDMLLRSGSGLFYNIDSSRFGNAKKEDVLSGVTFTSSSGLLEEGTLVVKEEEIGNYEYTSNGSKTITPSNGKVFSKVNVNINVPSSGTDTSDATVTENDLASGVIAYGANGKITGNVETHTGVVTDNVSSVSSNADNRLVVGYTFNTPKLFKQNAKLNITAPLALLGDAQATDVVKGKTFTGAGGYKVTGTYEPPTGGIDTSDATVTSGAMAEGIVAYGKDGKVVGTLPVKNNLTTNALSVTYHSATKQISIGNTLTQDTIVKAGTSFHWVDGATMGNATASDVAEGVTFTSENGLKVEGKLEVHDIVGSVGIASSYDKYKSGNDLYVDVFTDVDVLIRSGSGLGTTIPLSEFGTATEDKVLEGVTYTGADGHKKQGKMKASSGVTLPDGAIVVQKVIGTEASTQVGSGYSLSITYGSDVEINDSLALAFVGSTQTLSNISATTDFSVLQGKYIRSGSSYSTTGTFYYIPDGSTFTVGGQSMSKTLTCDRAQQVTIQKVSL